MARKIKLKPTPTQKKLLDEWLGRARLTYNWALSCINKKSNFYKKTNRYWMRNRFINKVNIPKKYSFLLNCPKQIRETSLNDLVEAYKTNFKIKAKNPNHRFDIKYRSKKDTQCISIEPQNIKRYDAEQGEIVMFPTFIKSRILFHAKKNKLPSNIQYQCKLLKDTLGKYSMAIVYHVPVADNQCNGHKHDWCAIDPGVRTLYTVYSPTPNVAYQIGHNDINRIYRLCLWVDRCMSVKHQNKKKLKKMRKRIKNLVNEVHCKTVHFLVNRFNNIILPPFEVKSMTNRINRKISSPTVRKMLGWSHYALKQRLLMKAEKESVNVHIRGEEYTSKTCTSCLKIKDNLGGAKTYRCSNCNLMIDRDLNGARNIFQKNAQSCD